MCIIDNNLEFWYLTFWSNTSSYTFVLIRFSENYGWNRLLKWTPESSDSAFIFQGTKSKFQYKRSGGNAARTWRHRYLTFSFYFSPFCRTKPNYFQGTGGFLAYKFNNKPLSSSLWTRIECYIRTTYIKACLNEKWIRCATSHVNRP
jgi:hypothetical protein